MKVVKLDCVEGWDVNIHWRGILVNDLIKEVNPKPDADTVIFYTYDDYSASFPLDYIKNNNILLANKMNNVTIPAEHGFSFPACSWGQMGL